MLSGRTSLTRSDQRVGAGSNEGQVFLPCSNLALKMPSPPSSQPRVSLYVSHKEDTLGGKPGLELARPRCLLLIKYRGLGSAAQGPGPGGLTPQVLRGAGLGTPRGAVAHLGEAPPRPASRRHSRKPRSWASVSARHCRSSSSGHHIPLLG